MNFFELVSSELSIDEIEAWQTLTDDSALVELTTVLAETSPLLESNATYTDRSLNHLLEVTRRQEGMPGLNPAAIAMEAHLDKHKN